MTRKLVVLAMGLTLVAPLFGQNKEDKRLANSATVLEQILSQDNGLPKAILDKAECVLIFPSVKKIAIGIGAATDVACWCAVRAHR